MNIFCFGESWTHGYGLDQEHINFKLHSVPVDVATNRWPFFLSKKINKNVYVEGICGGSNEEIANRFKVILMKNAIPQWWKNVLPEEGDLVIFGWGGLSRIGNYNDNGYFINDLSGPLQEEYDVDLNRLEYREKLVSNVSLDFLIESTTYHINRTINLCKIFGLKFLMFSVFDELNHESVIKQPMLEYLANNQGVNFEYKIPIWEPNFLHERNTAAQNFCDKYFDKNWTKAVIEREDLGAGKDWTWEGSQNFLPDSHPNIFGHKVLAEFIYQQIKGL